jgi:hypothetical protein
LTCKRSLVRVQCRPPTTDSCPTWLAGYEMRGNPSSAALNDRFTAQKFARAGTKQRLAKLFASPALAGWL